MLVVFGTYKFARKPVAYRADYCRACDEDRLTFAIRSFDAFHVFWIPILPLGFWTRWHCGECQAHPHEAVGINRWVRWAVAGLFVFMSLIFWVAALTEQSGVGNDIWIGASITTVLSFLTIVWAKQAKAINYKERRAQVRPFEVESCPLCDGHVLKALDGEKCQQCEAEHRPLPQATGMIHMS